MIYNSPYSVTLWRVKSTNVLMIDCEIKVLEFFLLEEYSYFEVRILLKLETSRAGCTKVVLCPGLI